MTKQEARIKFLKYRKTLACKEASQDKINKIRKNDWIQPGMKIGIYYPILNEIDLLSLVSLYPNVQFYLPVTKEKLEFVQYQAETMLISGPFHTKEPVGFSIPLSQLDIIFVPCLAINQDKKRLGYGKGYYDRTLKNYEGIKVGVCYDALCNQQFDAEEFDITLDWIV